MPKVLHVFALMRLTRGSRWRLATLPIHYDVKKRRLGVFLTPERAVEEGHKLGMTFVEKEDDVNTWLENFKKGDPPGFEIHKRIVFGLNRRTFEGILAARTYGESNTVVTVRK